MTLLKAESVEKNFSIRSSGNPVLRVLRGINLEVASGEFVAIVGPSGSGKSTFLHILGGLEAPTSGHVFWNGVDISTLSDETLATSRRTQVGFVFQFHHLLPEFSAMENVAIAMMIAGMSPARSREAASTLLEKVGLSDRGHHRPSELSGGEQQRVAIARAMANAPAALLADEPSGNLDSENSKRLYELLWELNRSVGQTIVVVTHNELLARDAHQVYEMVDGVLKQGI